jgi:hypothetical protein
MIRGEARPPLFIGYLPLEGAARLRERAGAGVVYNHPSWAGVLLEKASPPWQVAFDGRYYRYTAAEWQAQWEAAAGQIPLAEIVARGRPAAFFLRPGVESALIDLVRADGGWEEVYADDHAVAFVPRP